MDRAMNASRLREAFQRVEKTCHCEPVRLSGVAISRIFKHFHPGIETLSFCLGDRHTSLRAGSR